MALHRFLCKTCGQDALMESPIGVSPQAPSSCSNCHDINWRRDYSGVGICRPMMSHWNNTTGTEVSDMKGFKDDLKRRSEEATLKSGVEHNYEPIEYADLEKVVRDSDGVGLEATNRVRASEGKKTVDL